MIDFSVLPCLTMKRMILEIKQMILFNFRNIIEDLKIVTAIVLMIIDRIQINNVAQKLVDMSQVTEVFSVAGRYHLIVIIRVKSTEEVSDTITAKIGSLTGINATETLIAFRTYSRHDLEHMFLVGE